jgi:pyruvate/2-oxoglutarate dehydrogenase complex dihydrolipoamide acyltransferase (E2) component
VVASPYAKKLAREAGVDISDATPSGLGGRIVAADVEQLVKSGAPPSCACSTAGPAPAGAETWATRQVGCTSSMWPDRMSLSCAMAHQLLHSHSQRVSGGLFSDKQVPRGIWSAARPRA